MRIKLLLIAVLLLAFGLRVYKLTTPLADWHSWRQADTVSVTREYVKHGVDLLKPRFHDLSSIPNGLENPEGWRMVEFPLINGLIAFLYKATYSLHGWELHVFSRFFAAILSTGSVYLVYFVVKEVYRPLFAKERDGESFAQQRIALLSAFIFAVLPFNVFYSRSTLPEVPLVFFSLLGMYMALRYFHNLKNWELVGAAISFAVALLLKPIAVFFILPVIVLAWYQRGWKWMVQPKHTAAVVVAVLPLICWRWWIQQFPEGIPANRWLLNGNGIRLRPAWFRWLFADRLGRLILGYWGLVLFGAGIGSIGNSTENPSPLLKGRLGGVFKKLDQVLVKLPLISSLAKRGNSRAIFLFSWLLSMLLYLVIFATGNVQHDYYQVVLMPVISIFVALGIDHLLTQKSLASYFLLLTSSVFMLMFSWYEVQGFYNINNPAIVEAGKAVDELTLPDALVIAPYDGDTAFLYQTNRRGWPIGGGIEEKIAAGAGYYVTTALDEEAKLLITKFPVLEQSESFLLLQLQ